MRASKRVCRSRCMVFSASVSAALDLSRDSSRAASICDSTDLLSHPRAMTQLYEPAASERNSYHRDTEARRKSTARLSTQRNGTTTKKQNQDLQRRGTEE